MEKALFLPKMILKELNCYNKLKHLSQGAFLIPERRKIMSDLEYRAFLKETSDTLDGLVECCKETGELLKIIELKLKIAEQLYKCSQS